MRAFRIDLSATGADVRLAQLGTKAKTDCDSDSLVVQLKAVEPTMPAVVLDCVCRADETACW